MEGLIILVLIFLYIIFIIIIGIIYERNKTQSKVDNSSDFGDLHTKREETQSFKLLPEISEESIEVGLSDLKFSKETLREGEDVKVYATIINKKDRLRNKAVVFYYVPNAVDDEEDLSQYAQEKFEIYREFIDNLGRGETKEIVFDWAVKKDAKTIFVQAESLTEEQQKIAQDLMESQELEQFAQHLEKKGLKFMKWGTILWIVGLIIVIISLIFILSLFLFP